MEHGLSPSLAVDPKEVTFSGNFPVTASTGAVGTQAPLPGLAGVTVTKVAAKSGRYLLTFYRGFKRFKSAIFTVEGAADTANTTTTGGEFGTPMVRASGTSSVLCQLRQTSGADAEVSINAIIHYTVTVTDS